MEIRELERGDREALQAMYATFEPRGSAKGLPPVRHERIGEWIDHLLGHGRSLVAIDHDGRIFGHAVLADLDTGAAELAVFVHQASRGEGIGKELARAAVEQARTLGYERLWATVSPGNSAAVGMVSACGFRTVSTRGAADVELELRLKPSSSAPAGPAPDARG